MSTTSKRSVAGAELRDWKVWAIAAGSMVAVVHAAVQRLHWWAVLLVLPLALATGLATWAWLRRRPVGFAAEATRALAAHLPDGGRPPRVVTASQNGYVWEVEWHVADRVAGSALLKKTRDLEHQLGAALHLRFDRDQLRLRAGTAEIPDLVTYADFYRHPEPAGELVVGIGESRCPWSRADRSASTLWRRLSATAVRRPSTGRAWTSCCRSSRRRWGGRCGRPSRRA